MAYSFNKKETALGGRTEYSRAYAAFRGVDFSSEHTQIDPSRFAYLVNMYKDYQSGQGTAIETVAGYRRRADFGGGEIFGIFYFKQVVDGNIKERVLVHSGEKLFLWHGYPLSVNIPQKTTIAFTETDITSQEEGTGIVSYQKKLDFPCEQIISLKTRLSDPVLFTYTDGVLSLSSSTVKQDESLELYYYETVMKQGDELYTGMNTRKSVSFVCNNKLYILDGKNYFVYDGETLAAVKDKTYEPTTYINIPAGKRAKEGKEYEQRNFLSTKFKNTFVADGENATFYLSEQNLDKILSVTRYGTKVDETEYKADTVRGKITFLNAAPSAPEETSDGQGNVFEEGYAGIEVYAQKANKKIQGLTERDGAWDMSEIISKCTLCTTFDSRVFLSGNPDFPNYLFYCGRNDVGQIDPSYFGFYSFLQDGIGLAPITGMMSVSNTLMVLKADTQQDSAIYFHAGQSTESHVMPRIYASSQGLSGLGCVGACINFLDDPIFLSRLGVEGVSRMDLTSERATEHRSELIDTKLVRGDLSKACLEEWGGYLCLLTEGNIFLADSRQRYAHSTGAMQYEWYYLENIGVWTGQYLEYYYSKTLATELNGMEFTHEDGQVYRLELAEKVFFEKLNETRDLRGTLVNAPDEKGEPSRKVYTKRVEVVIAGQTYLVEFAYTLYETTTANGEETHAYLCESKGNYTGGVFQAAGLLRSMSDNLFFGCGNGVICSFNFDKRDENGELPPQAYSFDERTIFCGCATLMDNCQIPHLTKSTSKRSTVIKTKSFANSAAKVKVRTNKKPYEQIARINSSLFTFDNIDFSEFSFITTDQSLFVVNEQEKRWVEKQYYVYSDEYLKPFSLYYMSFRYRVVGRFKN